MSYLTDEQCILEVLDTLHSYDLNICHTCTKKSGKVDAHIICNEHFLFCEEAIEECLRRRMADWKAEVEKYNNDLRYQKEENQEKGGN